MLRAYITLLFLLGLPVLGAAQQAAPIPNTATLLAQVAARQQQLSQTLENYTWTQTTVFQLVNKNGKVERTTRRKDDVFFVHSHQIERLVEKNGKPLTGRQAKKEQARVMKAVARALKTPPGESLHKNTVSILQILRLMRTSQPRLVVFDGRNTLVFNFTGTSHEHTHGVAEDASKKMAGTMWVDEQSREVRRLTAHFYGTFHLGFGLFSIGKGSAFTFNQKPVGRSGVWLPSDMHAHLGGHEFWLVGYHAEITVTDSNYKVFHAEAIQAGAARSAAPR